MEDRAGHGTVRLALAILGFSFAYEVRYHTEQVFCQDGSHVRNVLTLM